MEAERKKEKTWSVDLSLLIIAMARDFSWSDRPKYMLTFFLALLSLNGIEEKPASIF